MLAGPIDLAPGAIARSAAAQPHVPGVTSLSPTEEAVLWEIRAPRVVLAALVGAMPAVAGATYQGVFRNLLADPYLLGVAAGAGLGATFAIVYLPDSLRGQRAPPGRRLRRRHTRSRSHACGRPLGEEGSATPPRSCSPASR